MLLADNFFFISATTYLGFYAFANNWVFFSGFFLPRYRFQTSDICTWERGYSSSRLSIKRMANEINMAAEVDGRREKRKEPRKEEEDEESSDRYGENSY